MIDILQNIAAQSPDSIIKRREEAEILNDFPDLTRDDLKACIAYAADRERRFMSTTLSA